MGVMIVTPAEILTFTAELLGLIGMLVPMMVNMGKVKNGQRCQLRSDMLRIYYHNIDSGEIRQYEFENFMLMYDAYKALKGNSFIDKICDEVKALRVVS